MEIKNLRIKILYNIGDLSVEWRPIGNNRYARKLSNGVIQIGVAKIDKL
jgi:hypothetical protein